MVVIASPMSNGLTAISPASATCWTAKGSTSSARVVGPQQLGRGADVARPEPGARPVGDAGVEGDADDGDVGMGHLVGAGQACEGGRARIARHAGGIDRSDRLLRRHGRQISAKSLRADIANL